MGDYTFTFDNGTVVHLRKLSQFLLLRLSKNSADKFAVPEKLVKVGTRGIEKLIPDYDNETYKKLIQQQEELDLADTLANLSSFAVIEEVPDELFSYYHAMAVTTHGIDVSDEFIKSCWIFDQLSSAEELGRLQNAISGITLPTEEGLKESQEKFPRED